MDPWMDTDGWMQGQMDGWMDRLTTWLMCWLMTDWNINPWIDRCLMFYAQSTAKGHTDIRAKHEFLPQEQIMIRNLTFTGPCFWLQSRPRGSYRTHTFKTCLSLSRPRGSYRTHISQEAKTCLSLSRPRGSHMTHTFYIVKVSHQKRFRLLHSSIILLNSSINLLGEESSLRVWSI